jgi:CheY-like chemotaxis protein
VLLVEDNDDDVLLTELSFERANVPVRLRRAGHGVECLEHLRNTEEPLPDLVLLDLNMPIMDGREVLRSMKGDLRLRHVPVVVLTTSRDTVDVRRAYEAYCNSYLIKEHDFGVFAQSIRKLCEYWFTLAELPG